MILFGFSLEVDDREMTPVQQSAVVLLLSLLENTLWDVALCHNALITTRQVSSLYLSPHLHPSTVKTCLIWHTLGEKFCVGMYKVSDNTVKNHTK